MSPLPLPPALLAALALALVACAPAPQSPPPAPVTVSLPSPAPSAPAPASPDPPPSAPSEADAAVPILPIDPVHGSRTALVTIVFFGDFQCPYTAKAVKTIHALEDKYAPTDLRLVWKNNPLPFHAHAREAAEAAEAVQMLGGSDAFWKFHDTAFANQAQLDPSAFDAWALAAGVSIPGFHQLVLAHAGGAKVDADVALAKQLGAPNTPTFFVNGTLVNGAQSEDKFSAIIDAELSKAKEHLAAGTSPELLYATVAKENYHSHPTVAAGPPADVKPDTTVWKIPITGAPSRGSDTALVTIVEFANFQCPFSKRVQATLDRIRGAYGDKVRIVWRDEPLGFQVRSLPAAELAREARAEKGLAGFWAVHDALFASQPKLDDSDFDTIATAAGLSLTKTRAAVATAKYAADIAKDTDLGRTLQVAGTPHFFINGRKLTGNQPFEKFQTLIDEELVHAQAVLAKGTPRAALYSALIRDGLTAVPNGAVVPGPTVALGGGLTSTDLVVGAGPKAGNGDQVTVHYVGTLEDGTEFDNSRTHGRPFSFTIGGGRVIAGWEQGLIGMRVGGRRRLFIPAPLAYGARSTGSIPANSNLVFEIEMLSIP